MAQETIVRAVFEAEEKGVAQTAAALARLEGAANDASKAQVGYTRASQTSAQEIAGVEKRVDDLQKRLAGAPAAWTRYERSMRSANDGFQSGQLNAESYARSVQKIQQELQRVVAPRLDMDVSSTGLSALLGTTEKVTAAQREAANEALKAAQVRQRADAEVSRSQEMLAEQAAKLRSELDPLGAAFTQLAEKQASYASMAKQGLISQDELTSANAKAKQSFDEFEASLTKTNGSAEGFFSRLKGFASSLNPLLGAIGASLSVGALVSYADSWSDMQSRVGAAVRDMEVAPAMMERIKDIANASYSPLDQTVEVFSRNVSVLRDLGYGAGQAADFTESLNNALVITATRGQRASSVQDALSKAMATGRLQADGLETVLANGGAVAEALAAELGTNVNGLRAMATAGKITGDVIANALINRLGEFRDRAAEMPATIGDAFTRLGTNLSAFIGQLDQGSGASEMVAGALLTVADNLDLIAKSAVTAGVGITAAFSAQALAAVRSMSVAVGTQAVAAFNALNAAISRNPLGAFAVAAATAATALTLFRDQITPVEGEVASLGDYMRALGETSASVWSSMSGHVSDWATATIGAIATYVGVQNREANLLPDSWSDAWDEIQSVFGRAIANVIDSMLAIPSAGVAAKAAFIAAWDNLPEILQNLGVVAVNSMIATINGGLAKVYGALGMSAPQIQRLVNDTAGAAVDVSAAFFDTFEAEQGRRRGSVDAVFQTVSDGFMSVRERANEIGAARTEVDVLADSLGVAATATGELTEAQKKARDAFADQIRTLEQNTEGLQRQIDLFGATAGATAAAELRAKELARAWDIAREAGLKALPETTKTAIDNAAASVENLTNQLERMNLERGQDDAMRMLEAEISLIGMSAEARKVAMAGLEAEQRLRSQNIATTDEWGQAYIRNAQAAAGMRVEIDRQTKAYETQQQFVENVLSTSLDALFNVGKAESWGDAVLGIFADIGRQFQELAKQNLMQAIFGQNYTTGQLAPGQRSIAQPGFPAGFGGAPVAANQNVPAAGGLNLRSVTALNDNLQRSSRSALDVARQFDGLNERADSAVLDSFMQASGNWRNLSAANTAWCAAFANAAIMSAGGRGTNSNRASSFMDWGQGTNNPQIGDVVVLKPQARGASGHVGFVAGFGDGTVQVFGGNQSNAANTRSFGLDQVRGYRTGVGVSGAGVGGSVAMPPQGLPYIDGGYAGYGQTGGIPIPTARPGGSWFGEGGKIQNFMKSPVGQLGMQGIGAFGAGYSSGSAGGGALQGGLGAFVSSGFNPIAGVVGLVGGAIGGLFGRSRQRREQRRQEQQQRNQQWEQMAPQWAEYQRMLREDTGPASGLRAAYGAIDQQMVEFNRAGSAATRGPNNSAALFNQVSNSRVDYQRRTNEAFQRRYWGTVGSLEGGQGMSSPFVEAQNAIAETGKALTTFIDDATFVFGEGSAEALRAREASITQLRAMVSNGQELSEVAAQIQQMEGAAASLRFEMTKFGVSAEDAGRAVDQDLANSMGRLRGEFSQGIQDQLWAINGKSYISDFRQFFVDIDQGIQDAIAVGADRSLVDQLFTEQAQSMVDGAQLSGEAFNELLSVFPRLAGVVREFSEAAEEAVKRTADQLATLRMSYDDRVFETTIDTSTEAGALARFDRFAAREREEEIRAGGEAILDLERALAAERGQIIKQFADRAIEEQKRALESAQSFLDGFSRNIGSYLDELRAGPDSPLTGQARVDEARKQFDAQLVLARGGDRDALGSITSYADRLLEADRAYNTSSPAAQATRDNVMSALENLPKQLKAEDIVAAEIAKAAALTVEAIQSASIALAGRISTDFDRLDTSLDGLLSYDELRAGLDVTDAQLRRIFAEIDLNGDHQISRLESLLASDGLTRSTLQSAFLGGPNATAGALAPHFARLDTSVNGLLDFNEMRAALGGIATDAQIRQMMNVLDANGDGQISHLELLNARAGMQVGSLTETQRLTQLVWQTSVNSAAYQERIRHYTELNHGVLGSISSTLSQSLSMQERIRANLAEQNGRQGLRQFAMGGISNVPAIFGEAGPEAAVPLPDGRTIPVTLSMPPMPRLRDVNVGGVNDNASSALLTEVKALREEVRQLREENNAVTVQAAERVARPVEKMTGATEKGVRETRRARRTSNG